MFTNELFINVLAITGLLGGVRLGYLKLGHFHERVGESPRSYENFGTSGSKIARFVSEIWPFEVGIAVRPNSA